MTWGTLQLHSKCGDRKTINASSYYEANASGGKFECWRSHGEYQKDHREAARDLERTRIVSSVCITHILYAGCSAIALFQAKEPFVGKYDCIGAFFAASTYIGSYIPHFVTSDFGLSQRTLVPIFGAFSLLMLAIISLDSSPKARYVTAVVIVTFLLGNSVLMESIFSNHLAKDDLDRAYAKAIHASIENYTNRTGIDIDYLAIERDAYPTWSYDGIDYVTYDMNVRNILVSWSNIGLMNTANGTDYQPAEMDAKIWVQYFDGKNWDRFSPDEQIVFNGNTAYIVIY